MLDQDAQDRLVAALEESGRHCGLHATHVNIQQPDPDDPSIPEDAPMLVLASFDVGKLAFTPRVLDPQDEDMRADFREMITDEQREQVKKLKAEGMSGALAELENDDPEGL